MGVKSQSSDQREWEGVGMKSWEREGMVCQKLFPHISSTVLYQIRAGFLGVSWTLFG